LIREDLGSRNVGLGAQIAKNLVGGIAAVIGASLIVFACFRAFPGDPARLVVGEFATEGAYEAVQHQMGLDRPLYTQYWLFITGFVKGDWGFSWTLGQPVSEQIGQRLPASIELALAAFTLTMILSVIFALGATFARRHRVFDPLIRGVCYVGIGMPPFLAGLLLLLLFSRWLDVLPGPEGELSPQTPLPEPITHSVLVDSLIRGDWGTAWDASRHLILPTIALSLAPLAVLTRILRANLLEVRREPFILLVRSKGVSRWSAASRHALPNAYLPTLTVSGIILGHMIGSAILVETVFHWPGVGALTVESALRKDFALPQTIVLLTAIFYVLLNTLVDILYGVIDPRVRLAASTR
jgi:ABC-type dipeptide/oligopeptide/nickel transport system permease component